MIIPCCACICTLVFVAVLPILLLTSTYSFRNNVPVHLAAISKTEQLINQEWTSPFITNLTVVDANVNCNDKTNAEGFGFTRQEGINLFSKVFQGTRPTFTSRDGTCETYREFFIWFKRVETKDEDGKRRVRYVKTKQNYHHMT